MSTYADRSDIILEALDNAGASIRLAQYELGGARESAAEALMAISQARTTLEAAERATVALLRSAGATWQDIGDAYGTTRQAAQQRWSD